MERRLLDIENVTGVLLIRDRLELSAAFLIPHLLQLALAGGLKVVLVLAQDSLSHYQQALRKLGTNLSNCIAHQQVVPVSIVSCLSNGGGLQQAIQHIAIACQDLSTTSGKGVCVLVDSLSAVHGLSSSVQEWQAFLHCCRALESITKGQYCCVMLAHDDVEEDGRWIKWLQHAAQVEVEVRALDSGASQEVTGQVLVIKRQASSSAPVSEASDGGGPLDEPRKLFFKLSPGDVRFSQ